MLREATADRRAILLGMANPASLPPGRRALFLAVFCGLSFLLMELMARVLFAAPTVRAAIAREHEQVVEIVGLSALNRTMAPDPDLFWALRPGLSLPVTGQINGHALAFHVSTNELGLRGGPVPPKGDALRILAIGDSCTFGVGVGDEATWPARLQALMRRGGARVEVINAGVPGYTAYQGLQYLRTRGLALKPDLVAATFGFNDADSWASRSDVETAEALKRRGWDAPLMHSRLYASLKALADRLRPAPPVHPGGRPRLSPSEFTGALVQIGEATRHGGARFLPIIWPYAAQVDAGQPALIGYQPYTARAGELAGVEALNLVPTFVAARRPLFLDHVHANEDGCLLTAEAVAGAIAKYVTRPPPPE